MPCKEEEDEVNAYLLTIALPVVKVQKRTLTYWIQTKKKGIFFPYYGKIKVSRAFYLNYPHIKFYLEGKSATPSHQSTSISPTVSDESSD